MSEFTTTTTKIHPFFYGKCAASGIMRLGNLQRCKQPALGATFTMRVVRKWSRRILIRAWMMNWNWVLTANCCVNWWRCWREERQMGGEVVGGWGAAEHSLLLFSLWRMLIITCRNGASRWGVEPHRACRSCWAMRFYFWSWPHFHSSVC